MIPSFGARGAAMASLVTQIFTNVIIGFIIKPVRRNNYLMIQGLNFRNIKKFVCGIIKNEKHL
jgi:hypothetical protein